MNPRTPQEYLSAIFFGCANQLRNGAQSRELGQSPLENSKCIMFEQLLCRNMRQIDRNTCQIDRRQLDFDRFALSRSPSPFSYISIYLFKKKEERRKGGEKTADRNKIDTQTAVTENESVLTGFSVNLCHTFIYKKQTLGCIKHQLTERQVCFPPTLFFSGEKICPI